MCRLHDAAEKYHLREAQMILDEGSASERECTDALLFALQSTDPRTDKLVRMLIVHPHAFSRFCVDDYVIRRMSVAAILLDDGVLEPARVLLAMIRGSCFDVDFIKQHGMLHGMSVVVNAIDQVCFQRATEAAGGMEIVRAMMEKDRYWYASPHLSRVANLLNIPRPTLELLVADRNFFADYKKVFYSHELEAITTCDKDMTLEQRTNIVSAMMEVCGTKHRQVLLGAILADNATVVDYIIAHNSFSDIFNFYHLALHLDRVRLASILLPLVDGVGCMVGYSVAQGFKTMAQSNAVECAKYWLQHRMRNKLHNVFDVHGNVQPHWVDKLPAVHGVDVSGIPGVSGIPKAWFGVVSTSTEFGLFLTAAVKHNSCDIVQLLLDSPLAKIIPEKVLPDHYLEDNQARQLLMQHQVTATLYPQHKHMTALERYTQYGTLPDDGIGIQQLYREAVCTGRMDLLQRLDDDVRYRTLFYHKLRNPVFAYTRAIDAICREDATMLEFLLPRCVMLDTTRSQELLESASEANDAGGVLRLVLSKGTELGIYDKKCITQAACAAAEKGHANSLRLLLETGLIKMSAMVSQTDYCPDCVLMIVLYCMMTNQTVVLNKTSDVRRRAVLGMLDDEVVELEAFAIAVINNDDEDEALFVEMLCGPVMQYTQLVERQVLAFMNANTNKQ